MDLVVTSNPPLSELAPLAADGRLLQQMIEAAPTAMLLVSTDGLIQLVNKETERLFDYPRSQLLGQPIEILVPAAVRSRHPGLRSGFFAVPASRMMGGGRDLFGVTRDGREVPVEIGLSPVQTENGIYAFAAVVDISQRKRAEEALLRRTEELAASNRDLEQFAFLASHDLQEPLRAVAGCVQLLKARYHGQIDAKGDQYIEHAVAGAARMQRMIDDLLALSRVGRNRDGFRRFDSGRALATAMRNLTSSIEESGARVGSGPLPEIFGDEGLFTQLFQNLVGNSIKFRRPEMTPKVEISARRDGTAWRFTVSDNGIGIDPQFSEKVFGIFRRLHSHKQYPGSGIGLSMCKRIVEAHGGSIVVEPSPPPGATLSFTIPDFPDAGDANEKGPHAT